MSALLQAPCGEREEDGGPSDHRLVAGVRRGDDRAFETLYQRYCRRIHAYVMGMVKDHGRAEDVTQDVFVSALRRMRATERPIAFKPWIYEIAKNACIDQFRRTKRAEVVSIDAEDGLTPSDYGRLVSAEPIPDAAVAAKQDLDHLCGAFGGLSDAHHQILVLRELEGLSYREIGERMGMSRPAVESTLFRARRRITEEYDDLASGQRCTRIQSIIASVSGGTLGVRDSRRLARHVSHCQPCRREALAAGLDSGLLAPKPMRDRVAAKVAGLLPFPGLERLRRGGGSGADTSWFVHLPAMPDQMTAGWAKVATAAALLLAGAGVGTELATKGDGARASRAAAQSGGVAGSGLGAPAAAVRAGGAEHGAEHGAAIGASRRDQPRLGSVGRAGRTGAGARALGGMPSDGADRDSAGGSAPAGGSGGARGGGGAATVTKPSGGSGPARPADRKTATPQVRVPAVRAPKVQAPPVELPAKPVQPGASGESVTGTVQGAVPGVVQGAGGATGAVTEPAGEIVPALP